MTEKTRIASLADHLELVPVVAQWLHREWGHLHPGDSLATRTKQLYERTQHCGIPAVFVALKNRTPVGTAGLREYDTTMDRAIEAAHTADAALGQAHTKGLETRPDLTPWLVSVYVVPEYRRRGIASLLVRHAMQAAQRLGVENLYLYTDTDGAEALYRRLGWQVVERLVFTTMHTTIMVADLTKTLDLRPSPGKEML